MASRRAWQDLGQPSEKPGARQRGGGGVGGSRGRGASPRDPRGSHADPPEHPRRGTN